MQKYREILILFLSLITLPVFGQNELYEEPVVIYSNQMYGGVHLHSNGLGGTFTWGKYRNAKQIMTLGVDALFMRHEKEVKSFNPVYEDSRSYVYGKVNNFYILRPTVGVKKMITEKLRKSGVQVGYSFQFGPSLGFTKPVYLEIGYPSIPYEYVSVERYDPEEHFFDDIYGRASGLNGLNELRLHPGAFAKFALDFEYSNEKDGLKGLEAGVAFDGYLNRIPIMAETITNDNNRRFFLTFFLNFYIGRKYNTNS